jgi:hypothetical protein
MAELLASATSLPYDQRVAGLTEASHLHADNVWIINTGFFTRPFIKSGRLGNAPDKITRNAQNASNPPFQLETLYAKYEPGQK